MAKPADSKPATGGSTPSAPAKICKKHDEVKPCVECMYQEVIDKLVEEAAEDRVVFFVPPNFDDN